jgi:UDP-N-acetylmuramate dehydrogenase
MSAMVEDVATHAEPLRNEPMRRHTSWRVGGPADLYYEPASVAELQEILASLPRGVPLLWLGLGSNLLVRDGGVRGAVIATGNLPRELERLDGGSHDSSRVRGGVDGSRVRAGAGLPCALLARQCVRWQLGPAAFFAGIPGSVGGALAMNAGAFGGETWTHVERVTTIDRAGKLRERARDEFTVGYRSVQGPPSEWFLGATFALARDSTDASALKAMLARRNATQPLRSPSCGSVFRNPPGDHAGRLIESVGLKGARIGGAVVSEKHANFIINDGDATAEDIERLIERVRTEVEKKTGVLLELEVRVVGEPRIPR